MPTGEQLHPQVLRLQREDPKCLAVLAALARSADTGGTLTRSRWTSYEIWNYRTSGGLCTFL